MPLFPRVLRDASFSQIAHPMWQKTLLPLLRDLAFRLISQLSHLLQAPFALDLDPCRGLSGSLCFFPCPPAEVPLQLDHSSRPRGEGRKPVGGPSPVSFSRRALQNPTNELALQTLIRFCERTVFDSMSSSETASVSISLYEKTQKNLQNFHKTRG
ncbi:unnamed protein product [Rangifer tarandus platyrhynchus]|uniref:Uncharacterized protein n=2 Tax=Rangifer tarandus platyrhynchus TaxID=3082113 RepID=A0ABN8ZL59_RANTA|nr:unnamed protein product [Rangifer tarandus platyrhynchus]CAI9708250.1 unnamed protein product [Rangifer tarandus platyrhynchus]